MSTETTFEIESTSSTQTEQLGEAIGRNLKGGEVIELVSDLGGGKTTFVRGLAQGFGSDDHVSSPSFTINKVYKAGNRDLIHFDLYRLGEDAGLMQHEVQDMLGDPNTVVVLEWADSVQNVLPDDRLVIRITKSGEDSRSLHMTCVSELQYLLNGVNS